MSNETSLQNKQHMGMKKKTRLSNTAIYIILVIMSIIWLFPFVSIVLQSFRGGPVKGMTNEIIPKIWSLENYKALAETDFFRWPFPFSPELKRYNLDSGDSFDKQIAFLKEYLSLRLGALDAFFPGD